MAKKYLNAQADLQQQQQQTKKSSLNVFYLCAFRVRNDSVCLGYSLVSLPEKQNKIANLETK